MHKLHSNISSISSAEQASLKSVAGKLVKTAKEIYFHIHHFGNKSGRHIWAFLPILVRLTKTPIFQQTCVCANKSGQRSLAFFSPF